MRKFASALAVVAVLAAIVFVAAPQVSTNTGEPIRAVIGDGQTIAGPYAIARGTITLDGSNPSSATTGLVTIVACAIGHKGAVTPGDDPSYLTTATSAVAGRLDVYAWKNTGGTDPTLVASTDADDLVDWICIGTL